MLAELLRVTRAGVAASIRQAIRVSATREAPGFDDAWSDVDFVPGWLPEVTAAVHWGVVAETRPHSIVEIGTYQGRSAVLWGLALRRFVPEGRLVTIDPHSGGRRLQAALGEEQPTTVHLCRAHLAGAGLLPGIVEMRQSTSEAEAAAWTDPIDLAYIDGWHTYEAALHDGLAWGRHLTASGLIGFDDAGSMPDVLQGARAACDELGLHWYGTLLGQAWAGRPATPPRAFERARRLARFTA